MSRHRDFDAARAEHQGEPLPFRLAGREFTVARVPAAPMFDLAQATATGDSLATIAAFGVLLYKAVPEDQHAELRASLEEIELPTALEVVNWLIGESMNRPLGSAGGSSDTGSSNGAASSLAAEPIGWTRSA